MLALPIYGWSFFHEFKPFSIPVSLLGRYDNITHRESGQLAVQEFLGGVAYTFSNSSKIILSYKNREDGVPFGDARTHAFRDRKSTRLNSSHVAISYAVFCLKKKKARQNTESSSLVVERQ